jgi:hypothetical protein
VQHDALPAIDFVQGFVVVVVFGYVFEIGELGVVEEWRAKNNAGTVYEGIFIFDGVFSS